MRSVVARVVPLALAAAGLPLLAPPVAQAAECTGPLRAELTRIQVAYALVPPPAGFAYATQPSTDPEAGGGVPVSVTATRTEGCAVASASVELQAREPGQAEYRTVRTGSTNTDGYATFDLEPLRQTELRAVVTSGQDTVQTAPLTVTVRRALSATYASAPGCAVTATGRVYPRAAGLSVWLQRRITRDGQELGFTTLAKGVTDADGVYRLRASAPCGARYALVTYAPTAAGTTAGRARYVDLDVAARP